MTLILIHPFLLSFFHFIQFASINQYQYFTVTQRLWKVTLPTGNILDMPSQKASSKKVYITQESPRRSNESFTSQSSSSTAYSYGSYGSYETRFETRYESPATSNMGRSEYSGSTSSRSRETLLRVPDHRKSKPTPISPPLTNSRLPIATKETISKKSRGKVDVFLHEQRREDKSEPRSGEATQSDYNKSKSGSKRHN
jgi:hypothetical protein